MWVMYFFISYLVLALVIPVALALGRVYLRTRKPRTVTCPADNRPAVVALDVRHAITTRILADCSLRAQSCSFWPEKCGCGQECLRQIQAVGAAG